MPTPSCRDLLSREIYDPVYDPFTGVCFRNPCAAEESGVTEWLPGCMPAPPPVYGSYEYGAPYAGGWAWDGGWDRPRRHRGWHRRPGGGRFGAPHPGIPRLSPPDFRAPPTRLSLAPGDGGGVMRARPAGGPLSPGGVRRHGDGGPMSALPAGSPLSARAIRRDGYTAVTQPAHMAPMRSDVHYAARPAQAMTAMRPSSATYAGTRATARPLKGLGQTTATSTPAPPTVPRAMTQAEFGNRFDPIYRFRQTWIDPPPDRGTINYVPIPGSPVGPWILRIASVVGAVSAAGLASRLTRSRAAIAGAAAAGLLVAPMAFRPSFTSQSFSLR